MNSKVLSTLSSKVLAALGLTIIGVAALVGVRGVSDFLQSDNEPLVAQTIRKSLFQDANEIRTNLVRCVSPARERTRITASDPDVIDAVSSRDVDRLYEVCNQAIVSATEIDTIALYDADGEILAINTIYADGTPVPTSRLNRVLASDFSKRDIIQSCLRDASRTESIEFQLTCDITPAFFDSSGLSVAISIPIIIDGVRVGLVSSRMRFSRLTRLLEASIGVVGGRWFVGDDGRFFDESINASLVGAPLDEQALIPALQGLRQGTTDTILVERQTEGGESEWLALARVDEFEVLEGGGVNVLVTPEASWLADLVASNKRSDLMKSALGTLVLLALGSTLCALGRFSKNRKVLQAALEEANVASRHKSEFLANVSHEIRTPMTSILGYADLIFTGDRQDHEITDAVQTIRRNGDHLLALINDLLDLSKLEAGHLDVESVNVKPLDIVCGVVELLSATAAENNVTLRVEATTPIPNLIQSDPTRLRQIMFNIVGNGIKFTHDGAIDIRLTAFLDQQRIEILVSDTGIGIPAEHASQVFEPFRQADSTVTRKYGGTGLGLPVSKKLARRLGGDVVLRPQSSGGCCFEITIATGDISDGDLRPAGLVEWTTLVGSVSAQPTKSGKPSKTALAGIQVLLAEDGPDNRRLVTHFVEGAGATMTLVENGQEAVDLLDTAAEFDVVLMDMQMPILDGYSATSELRSRGYTGPIIALTANAMTADRQRALDAGCNNFISKPIDRQELIEAIAAVNERQVADPA